MLVMLIMERGILRVAPASQQHLCGHDLVPECFPRGNVTEGGTRVEGACGQEGVQGKSGMGRNAGWLSEAGEGCLWLRGTPTPRDCSVRPGVVTSWKRDTLNPARGSLSCEAELQAGSLLGV